MTEASTAQPEPHGIGGWLIIPALCTIVGPLLSAYGVFLTVDGLLTHTHSQSAMWIYFISGEAIAALAMTAGWIVALVLLFKYRRSYPGLFITLLVGNFFIGLIDVMLLANIFEQEVDLQTKRDIGQSFLAMVIWGAYMHESRRVKNTFVS